MADIKVDYRGIAILVDTGDGKWTAQDNGEFGEFESVDLNIVKEWVDKKIEGKEKREKAGFKRIPIYMDYRGPLRPGEITSIAGTTSYSGDIEVWVTFFDEKGKSGRLKASLRDIYRKDDATTVVYERIDDRRRQIKELEREITKDINALREKARLTEKDIAAYQDKEV
jgi:hypothetical protein